jgi:hypothetical protein
MCGSSSCLEESNPTEIALELGDQVGERKTKGEVLHTELGRRESNPVLPTIFRETSMHTSDNVVF